MSASSASQGIMSVVRSSGSFAQGLIRLLRDAVAICDSEYVIQGVSGSLNLRVPPPGVFMLDAVAAGTYVYQVQARVAEGTVVFNINNVRLVAYEI